jgi:hypothetical protein
MNRTSPSNSAIGKSSSGFGSGFLSGLERIGDNALKGFGNSLNQLAESKSKGRDFSGISNPTAREIAQTWGDLGWSNKAIAVGLGNVQQESAFNPKARNKGDAADGTDSVGLFQHNKERLAGLERFAKQGDVTRGIPAGSDPLSPRVQAAYVDKEMKTTHKSAWSAINDAPDIETASNAWSKKFEVADPAANRTRSKYSNSFAKTLDALGIDDVTGYDKEISGAIAGIENLGRPVGSKPSQFNTDPFGIGSIIANALGIQDPNTGKQKSGYVDPMVSSVEGRKARGEEDPDMSPENLEPKRSGLAGIAQKAEKGKPGVAVDIAKAVSNPIGFALSTIMDFGRQSKAMNTPGPEGIGGDGQFGIGFLAGLLGENGNGNAGFVASEKNGSRIGSDTRTSQAIAGLTAPENAAASTFIPVNPLTPPVLTPDRKPFGWSLV